jgi:hypothetical protein
LGNGFYRLSTKWLGEEYSLEVMADGKRKNVQMAPSADVTGQYWKIAPSNDGYYRLTNRWLGTSKSLDIINDRTKSRMQMASTADVSGQYWEIVPQSAAEEDMDGAMGVLEHFQLIELHGFRIMVNQYKKEELDTKKAVNIISDQLAQIVQLLKPEQVKALQNVPIWLEFKKIKGGGAWYHASEDWLKGNGYPTELNKSVEICNLNNFIESLNDQPYVVLHELAHAYHDLFLEHLKAKIEQVYEQALQSGKYDMVEHVGGGTLKHYAMNSVDEYFAELTEAYFGKNDYFPFNRNDLKKFDPAGYQLMEEAWGKKD